MGKWNPPEREWLNGKECSCRAPGDTLRRVPLRGGSGVWTTEVPAPAPPPPPALSELGVSCLSVRICRLRRPPTFHGEGGGRCRGATGHSEGGGRRRAEGEGPARLGAVGGGRDSRGCWVVRAGEVGRGKGLGCGTGGSAKVRLDLRRCAGR